MNGNRRVIALILFAVATGLLIWWAAAGANIFTTTEHLVLVKDDLFGTTTEKWEKGFTPGLELIGPIAGVLLVAGGWMLFAAKRKWRAMTASQQ